VAVFLVIGGLLSGASVFKNKAGVIEAASTHRNAEFFISTARGAENAAALFGARPISPVAAVFNDGAPGQQLVFSTARGAVKDTEYGPDQHGASSGSVQISSLNR
jgi:hypothetical protein